jgi:hypothetical protein
LIGLQGLIDAVPGVDDDVIELCGRRSDCQDSARKSAVRDLRPGLFVTGVVVNAIAFDFPRRVLDEVSPPLG